MVVQAVINLQSIFMSFMYSSFCPAVLRTSITAPPAVPSNLYFSNSTTCYVLPAVYSYLTAPPAVQSAQCPHVKAPPVVAESTLGLLVGCSAAAILLVLVAVLLFWIRRRRRRKSLDSGLDDVSNDGLTKSAPSSR